MFLQGAGKTLMAMPFLQSLMPREAWGQTSSTVKRYISLHSSYELGHNSLWLPRIGGSVTNLVQPNRVLNVSDHHPVRWQPLTEFVSSSSTPLAPLYGTSLNPYLQHINIMRGLDVLFRYGHGSGSTLGALTDADGGRGAIAQIPTIDTILSSNQRINPSRRLIYGGHTGNWEGISLNASGVRNSRIEYLEVLYNTLFENGNFPETGSTNPAPAGHPKRDLLSRVLEDYNRVRNSRNISALDRGALSDAMDKMSDVHRGLASVTVQPVACSHRGLTRLSSVTLENIHSSEQSARALVDMITAAIMCDTSRIFTFGFLMAYDQYSGFTDPVFNYVGDWHQDISHRPFAITNGRVNYEWVGHRQSYLVSRVFAPLIQRLSTAIDPSNGQSYLYNSIVHLAYESGQVHGNASHPAILAGNAGGAIRSGNYIDYSNRAEGTWVGADNFSAVSTDPNFSNNYRGVNYNRLLVNIMQAMGLSPSEYEVIRSQQVYNRTDIGTQNANLTNIGGYGYAFNVDRNANLYDVAGQFAAFRHYDLRQFRNGLPIPG